MKYPLDQLEKIFQEVMDLPETERETFLASRCGQDTELRRQVELLVEQSVGADTFFTEKLGRIARTFSDPPVCNPGQRVGPYRLIRELGAGGMATVYLANRDDGHFDQIVAIKVARYGVYSAETLGRFVRERQLQANLVHPNIARLLDGGSMANGLPYLVMEYIEGEPITVYARERKLTIQARLELFLGVCEAVSHAHRSLVVHRDVKPGNILVTSEGVPKLLDFGISKLLEPGQHSAPTPSTVSPAHFMTPEYASPEQILGESITTATDVYSLGAVLYELLTGQCPRKIEGQRPVAMLRAICETDPIKPSRLGGSALAGDLDNLMLMAMRKDPRKRYASVEHMAEDIRRYLARKPLVARDDTFAYRSSKFIQRHKVGAGAAMLVLLSLVGGIAATAWQARRVVEQVERAESRFLLFRKLGNSFLFELHEKIAGLNSLTEAREMVLATASEYLDGLAREAAGDTMMIREVARGYEKIGDAQGVRHPEALQRPMEAAKTYRKAIAITEPLYRGGASDEQAILLMARCYCNLGEVLDKMQGHEKDAEESYRKCRDAASTLDDSRLPSPRREGLLARANRRLRQ